MLCDVEICIFSVDGVGGQVLLVSFLNNFKNEKVLSSCYFTAAKFLLR